MKKAEIMACKLLLFITTLTLVKGWQKICDEVDECVSITVDCLDDELCDVICNQIGACTGITINCPANGQCTTTCSGSTSCVNAKINCNNDLCNIHCSGIQSCMSASINCAGSIDCTVQGQGANAFQNATINGAMASRQYNVFCHNGNTCKYTKIYCGTQIDCNIECDQLNACDSAQIYGAANKKLIILCQENFGCQNTEIDARDTSALEIKDCVTGAGTCRGIKIWCPPNDNGVIQCTLNGDGEMIGIIGYEVELYAINGFQDIQFSNIYNGVDFKGIMYCTSNYNIKCDIATTGWNCDPSGDKTCNAPTVAPTQIPSNNPSTSTTLEPTMNPSFAPITSIPTTSSPTTMEPTLYPTQSPSTNPSYIPTNNPTLSPNTMLPTTQTPTTSMPSTAIPTTSIPTTSKPTTSKPTTSMPTTSRPTNYPLTMIPTLQQTIFVNPTNNPIVSMPKLTIEVEIKDTSTTMQINNSDNGEKQANTVFFDYIIFVVIIVSIMVIIGCICCVFYIKKRKLSNRLSRNKVKNVKINHVVITELNKTPSIQCITLNSASVFSIDSGEKSDSENMYSGQQTPDNNWIETKGEDTNRKNIIGSITSISSMKENENVVSDSDSDIYVNTVSNITVPTSEGDTVGL